MTRRSEEWLADYYARLSGQNAIDGARKRVKAIDGIEGDAEEIDPLEAEAERLKRKQARDEAAGKRTILETQIQQDFVRQIRDAARYFPEFLVLHAIPNGADIEELHRQRLYAEGLFPGVSDISFPLPLAGSGGLYLEFKSANGRVSAEQDFFITIMSMLKYECHVVRDAGVAFDICMKRVERWRQETPREQVERFSREARKAWDKRLEARKAAIS